MISCGCCCQAEDTTAAAGAAKSLQGIDTGQAVRLRLLDLFHNQLTDTALPQASVTHWVAKTTTFSTTQGSPPHLADTANARLNPCHRPLTFEDVEDS
jgi:hypothetical protein